ncbi:hypothetical protein Rhow_006000 [Rhodococcus wratislaviensis]|uniref:Uncharacterized protein n=1 Tax=Rhodococcus wratislaviensis TaxID=44752 RepID=A0A402C075_RHOWR|nr:hypothetical protein Rhow_006000 [Rhodococcus wratislaviensis]
MRGLSRRLLHPQAHPFCADAPLFESQNGCGYREGVRLRRTRHDVPVSPFPVRRGVTGTKFGDDG